MSTKISEVRDNIASTQALIDQARAHLNTNRKWLNEEQIAFVESQLATKQQCLETAKSLLNVLTVI